MIARYIIGFFALADPVHEVLHDFHVAFRPIPFAELPDVYDVAVKYDSFGIDAPEIVKKFFGAAPVSAQVHIRKHQEINLSFFVFGGFVVRKCFFHE
jgi:hypothetical protein